MTEEAAPGAVFRLVHLEGGAAQFKEIMAGNIDVAFDNVGTITTRVKSGEVRVVAGALRTGLEPACVLRLRLRSRSPARSRCLSGQG
jgi:hypothetical protein